MDINLSTVVAPAAFPYLLDIGHTCVSCPHQGLPCPRNTLWPKNDCPNKAFFVVRETAEISSSISDLSNDPITPISISSVAPKRPGAHDQVAHSIQPLRTLNTHKLPGCLLQRHLLSPLAISENNTSVPRQRDTDSAISYVITFETGCSLFAPLSSMLRQQRERQGNSERLFQPSPCGTGIASPHDHTHRVWVSSSH